MKRLNKTKSPIFVLFVLFISKSKHLLFFFIHIFGSLCVYVSIARRDKVLTKCEHHTITTLFAAFYCWNPTILPLENISEDTKYFFGPARCLFALNVPTQIKVNSLKLFSFYERVLRA